MSSDGKIGKKHQDPDGTSETPTTKGFNEAEDTGLEPASSTSEVADSKRLMETNPPLAADRQRTSCRLRQPAASSGTDGKPEIDTDLALVVKAWPDLLPHVRETINTLVNMSLAGKARDQPNE